MYDNFVLEGEKIAAEILRQQRVQPVGIYALPEWIDTHPTLLQPYRERVHPASQKDLERVSSWKTPQRVLIVCQTPRTAPVTTTINQHLTLFLDRVQDPGNVGSILRIADWFGIPYVFLSPDCAEVYNPKVAQASMGALLRVPTVVTEFATLRQEFPDLPVLATTLDGTSVFQASRPNRGLLIIGNESRGVSNEILDVATHRLSIPSGSAGGAESLNAAVATGIFCAMLTNGGGPAN